jgi:hypothetical protein
MMMVLRRKTAEYWEGWQAYSTRQPCRYSVEQVRERAAWARGFAAAIANDTNGKVWWKSKAMLAGIALMLVGCCLLLFGLNSGIGSSSGVAYAAAGGGISVPTLIFTALRLITKEPITFGGGGQYNMPM